MNKMSLFQWKISDTLFQRHLFIKKQEFHMIELIAVESRNEL